MGKSWWPNKILSNLAILVAVAATPEAAMIGGTSGAYLRPAVGAAPLALGSAYSASPEYLAPWWNPAALARLKTPRITAGGGIRSLGRTDAFASFEFRVPPRVGMGLMLLYRGDPFLNDLYDDQENKLENASYTTFTGKIALSYYISRSLSAGANIGIFYQRLPTMANGGKVEYSSATGIGAIDLALSYKISKKWSAALIVSNLGASMNWEINSGYSSLVSPVIDDRPLPVFILGNRYEGKLLDKPFVWTMDIKGYIFDGEWNRLGRPEGVINTGWEWRYWEKFYIRAGIGDILINGDLVSETGSYKGNSPARITGGFMLDLSKYRKGMKFNYGISTDKVWAGVEQQLDITLTF